MKCGKDVLETEFAPAEYLPYEDVLKQHNNLVMIDQFDYFFNVNPLPAVILNEQRQVVHANKTLVEYLGAKNPLEVLGKRPGEAFNCIHVKNSINGCGTTRFCTTCGAVRSILKAQSGKRASDICRITTGDDSDFDALELEVWAEPMFRDKEIFTVFHIMDISDTKRRRALERVFFHDVLNTIQTIYGNIELCDESFEGEKESFVSNIKDGVNNLIEEINSQKALLDAENGDLETALENTDIQQLLGNITNQCNCMRQASGKNISVSPDFQNLHIKVDATLLKRVLLNMIKNALEATVEGGSVEITAGINSNKVYFHVHNDGYIPENIQLQIFKRSFSTKGSNRGLGTFSMKLFTEKYLCGHIGFDSDKINGTTFKLNIPAHRIN